MTNWYIQRARGGTYASKMVGTCRVEFGRMETDDTSELVQQLYELFEVGDVVYVDARTYLVMAPDQKQLRS
jgi:hypothetical protein